MGAVAGGDFNHGKHIGDRIHAGATVGFGNLDSHQAVFTQQADVVQWKFAGAVMVFSAGRDFLLRDATCHILNHQLLFSEVEIHNRLMTLIEAYFTLVTHTYVLQII